jgi:hypothetical protein
MRAGHRVLILGRWLLDWLDADSVRKEVDDVI